MSKPTQYVGTARIAGNVPSFVQRLDPQNWSSNAPQIWLHSYLVDVPVAVPGPSKGADRVPPKRSDNVPQKAGNSSAWPLPGLFFEDVIVAGVEYRNILQTCFVDDSKAASPKVHFDYYQHECLNADGARTEDGGIDVDNGFSDCSPDTSSNPPTHVIIKISKTVRFTQPSSSVNEMNALAHVLVPLTLDAWLHNLIFPLQEVRDG